MISASLSLSLPRLGWKSTSMPRSLKICTAAGDNASEMRTFGLVIRILLHHPFSGRMNPFSLYPFLWGEGWGEGRLLTGKRHKGPSPGASRRPLPVRTGRGQGEKSRRLREQCLGLGEGPVDPLRQQRNVGCLHRRAAPDAQARRRIAVMRKVVTGAFLFNQ